jgi:3-oxoadipate enol-lactonase
MLQHDVLGKNMSRPPVVLVHGFPLDRRVFAGVAETLAENFRVVNVDMLGFGESTSDKPFTLDDQAKAVHETLQARGLLPCVLAGLSMGGYVALAFHRRFAGDLDGLILIDTKASADTAEAKEGRNKMAELAKREGSGAVAAQMLPKMLASKPDPAKKDRLTEIMHACPATTISNALMAMRDRPDYTPDLATMSVPLLVITGSEDQIAPVDVGRAVAKAAPQGKFTEITGAGHMAPLEKPVEVANAIRSFLK